MRPTIRFRHAAAALVAATLLAACGGGGSEPAPPQAGAVAPVCTPGRIEPYTAVAPASLPPPAAAVPQAPGSVRTVSLPPLAEAKLAMPSPPAPGQPRQIGVARAVDAAAQPQALSALLQWRRDAAGGWSGALILRSPGALGLRAGLLVHSLPAGARVHAGPAPDGAMEPVPAAQILQAIERNAAGGDSSEAGRTYWLPEVAGEAMALRIDLPPGADPAQVRLAVPRLSHLVERPQEVQAATPKIGEASSCNIDAMCSPALAAERNAVARMQYVRDGGTFVCTGTLLADSVRSGTPWFLSANHCIGSQTVASTLVTDWFYRAAACGSRALNPATVRRTGGATLLYASAGTDTAFMRLNEPAPAGALFAGSLVTPRSSGAVAALHHARGDLLKASEGSLLGTGSCTGTSCSTGGNGSFLAVRWSSGTTEGGSSGSALFATDSNGRPYVVGQLFAGTASCSNTAGTDYYGRLDQAFDTALRTWLDPSGSTSAQVASCRAGSQ